MQKVFKNKALEPELGENPRQFAEKMREMRVKNCSKLGESAPSTDVEKELPETVDAKIISDQLKS